MSHPPKRVRPVTIALATIGSLLVIGCMGLVIVGLAATPSIPPGTTTSWHPAGSGPAATRPIDAAPTRGLIADPKMGQGSATVPTVTDGVWTVAEDIPAGTYKVTAPIPADALCYWGIYKAGTNKRDIIANDIPQGGQPKVTLKAGQEFETTGCGAWTKVAG